MFLKSVRIKNFKCFKDSGVLRFSPGFNILVGQNNSGKTTVLEALSFDNTIRPHRSIEIPLGHPLNPLPSFNFEFCITGQELRLYLLSNGADLIMRQPIDISLHEEGQATAYLESIFALKEVSISGEGVSATGEWQAQGAPLSSGTNSLEPSLYVTFRPSAERDRFFLAAMSQGGVDSALAIARSMYSQSLFRFQAQRSGSGRGQLAVNPILATDASNMPRVMLELNRSPEILDRLTEHMNDIFPAIKWIVVETARDASAELQISISAHEKLSARPDLLIPLSECGTGVGQVLAILLAALSSPNPRIILVDEPNSFLHPSAAKRLIDILRGYDHHQYILTTHSSEIIAAADPSTLHLTKWTGSESVVENLYDGEVRNTQLALADIGVQLSDIFGANEILWVEGMTEQMCFPKLINQLQGSNFRQAKVLALSNTSDFDHNRAPAKVVREIYTKLSVSNALVPRAVGFRLDREGRTDAQMNELESETARNIRFLHRRNYECYLLHPVAVVAVLSTVKFEPDVDLSAARIEQCMSALGGKRELGAARYWNNDIKNPVWLKHVDGAKLLHLLFGEVTNQQLEYKKTTHSVALTEWLVANDREHIQELFDFVSW